MDPTQSITIDQFYEEVATRFTPYNVHVSMAKTGQVVNTHYTVVIFREGKPTHACGTGTTVDDACKNAGINLADLNEKELNAAKQVCIANGLLLEDA